MVPAVLMIRPILFDWKSLKHSPETSESFPCSCATQKPHSPSQNAWSQTASESALIVSNLSGHSGNFQIGV